MLSFRALDFILQSDYFCDLLESLIWAGFDFKSYLKYNKKRKESEKLIDGLGEDMYVINEFGDMTEAEKEKSLKEVKEVCSKCKACELSKGRTNVVFSDGKASAKIMLIGEAPGADEDATGTPFVGRAGKYLSKLLEESGIDRSKDVYICNTVKCRPPQNRVPKDIEKSLCAKYLSAQISIVKPEVIVLCGSCAMESFIKTKEKISQARGKWYKILNGIKATVIFHPSYLLRNHSEEPSSPRGLTKSDLVAIKNEILK